MSVITRGHPMVWNCWCESYLVTLSLKLRYTTFIGDGVVKTFACLAELNHMVRM